jgi:uncharacterized protein (DUF1778 family)
MPSNGKTRSAAQASPVNVRMSVEERAALDKAAAERGIPISAVIRDALRPAIAPHMEQSA